ncbi:hypothetical protein AQUCO_01400527v1 [Aquilegia coerulea]|nr:hypothetical protein AQUCO_01400527v1 [Aquilegia coerulea]
MESGDLSEKKESIVTSAAEMGADTTEHKREDQGELPSEMPSKDFQTKDTKVSSMDTKEDPATESSGIQLSNKSDLPIENQGVFPEEMQSLNSDIKREDEGEVPSGLLSSDSSDLQRENQGEVPSGLKSFNDNDFQREHKGELSSEVQSLKDNEEDINHHIDEVGENLVDQNSEIGESTTAKPEVRSRSLDERSDIELISEKAEEKDLSLDDQTSEIREFISEQPEEKSGSVNNQTSEITELISEKPEDKSRSLDDQKSEIREVMSEKTEEKCRSLEEIISEEREVEPIFDGTEDPEEETDGSSSTRSSDLDPETQGYAWPDKAVAIKNFVREKSVVAVSSVIRRLSGKKDEDGQNYPESEEKNISSPSSAKDEHDLDPDAKPKEVPQKPVERSAWNPLSYIIGRDADTEQGDVSCTENICQPPPLKGRVLLYTRLGCQDCKEARLFLHQRKLRYGEINIDVYPSRKLELEKYTGSSAVPLVFFNEHPIGGLTELKDMAETGKLKEKLNDLITEEPSHKAPVPPLSGEDDESCGGMVDELALVVKKMRESILVKDRFYRMRRFSNCFVGSEAVDFLSENQYLERKEAIEFGQKLAKQYFFRHVLEENVFEDGNHLYRFLDHDPLVLSQCYNFPRGILEIKPKPIIDIASRLRFLSLAMFEAYASVDGRHVDYRSIHGSEEFARYLRVIEELQRVEMQQMSREERLAFFINLYNMMAIHAILLWGYPVGPLERRKMLGDFKYVIGGYTYSLSAIENGILRCNQRPPYNLMKPFGVRDQRIKIALPYPEPLIHFALVNGTRSGPALRCYSPSDIDKELMEAARNFLRNGGVIVDPESRVASVSKLLRW